MEQERGNSNVEWGLFPYAVHLMLCFSLLHYVITPKVNGEKEQKRRSVSVPNVRPHTAAAEILIKHGPKWKKVTSAVT